MKRMFRNRPVPCINGYAIKKVSRAWGGQRIFSAKKMSERSELFFAEKILWPPCDHAPKSKAQQTNYQGPTSGAGSTPPSRNSEADLPVHFRNARLKLDRSA